MGTAQQPPRARRHQRRPHAMLSQALLGMMQAAGAFQGATPPATLSLSHSRRSSMIANGRASLLCYYLTTSATSFGYGQQGRCVHYERIFYVLLSVVSIRCCVQGCTPVWECMRASPGPWGTSLEARLAQGACLLSCYSATGTSQTQTTRPCWPWMTAS